jgi:hypothetical protein
MEKIISRGKPGSPEFIEHQRKLGELYRDLLAKNVAAENGHISFEIQNRTYEQAMRLLPFEILEDSNYSLEPKG